MNERMITLELPEVQLRNLRIFLGRVEAKGEEAIPLAQWFGIVDQALAKQQQAEQAREAAPE